MRSVQVEPSELDGLPQDYIDAHPANDLGLVTITTDYPDLYPVMTYAKSDSLRKALRLQARSRGYPANKALLERLIAKRHELARMLGYESYAALSMDSQMIGSPVKAQAFLDSVGNALPSQHCDVPSPLQSTTVTKQQNTAKTSPRHRKATPTKPSKKHRVHNAVGAVLE